MKSRKEMNNDYAIPARPMRRRNSRWSSWEYDSIAAIRECMVSCPGKRKQNPWTGTPFVLFGSIMPRLESVWSGFVIHCMRLSEWDRQQSHRTTRIQNGTMPSCWERSEDGSGGSEPIFLKVIFISASGRLNLFMDPGRVCSRNGARIQSNMHACSVWPWRQKRSRRFLRKHQKLPVTSGIVIPLKGYSALCGRWGQELFTNEISSTWSTLFNVPRTCECATRQSIRTRSLIQRITSPTHPRNDFHRARYSPYITSGTPRQSFLLASSLVRSFFRKSLPSCHSITVLSWSTNNFSFPCSFFWVDADENRSKEKNLDGRIHPNHNYDQRSRRPVEGVEGQPAKIERKYQFAQCKEHRCDHRSQPDVPPT